MKPEEFGPFLAVQRKARDLTQYELAEKLNITVSAVSKWERCKCLPDITKIEELARIFDLTINEMLTCKVNCSQKQTSKQEETELLENYKRLQKKEAMIQTLRWVLATFIAVVITICVFLLRNNICSIFSAVFDSEEGVILSVSSDNLPKELDEAYKQSQKVPFIKGILAFMAACFTGGLMIINPNVFWKLRLFFINGNEKFEASDEYKFISRICGMVMFCVGIVCLMIALGL